jgi:hypothetical protein
MERVKKMIVKVAPFASTVLDSRGVGDRQGANRPGHP